LERLGRNKKCLNAVQMIWWPANWALMDRLIFFLFFFCFISNFLKRY
jgi:hypothetical protein